MQRDLTRSRPSIKCSIPFELRKLDDDAILRFKQMPPPFPRHYQYRYEGNLRHCYAAFHNEKIVALMWPFCKKDNEHMVTKWRFLLEDEARISNIWADPDYRGTGLMAACIELFANHLEIKGYRYLYCFTWENNHASIKLHKKLGFHITGKIVRFSFPFLKEGNGIYFRNKIPRAEISDAVREKDLDLPERLMHKGFQK